ncbi:MAG: hypothetical protein EXR29_12420 [Betaproteobacteria bacterium]|nr:hypothetical protein [Betaproteobacteria bacterium]
MEKLGTPAVSVITTAFEVAGRARARILGCERHPRVAMEHPLASRSTAEIARIAEVLVGQIATALTKEA